MFSPRLSVKAHNFIRPIFPLTVTTFPAFSAGPFKVLLDCGNGTSTTAAIADGSYIAMVCNYGAQGTFTATLTTDAGPESDTADVAAFDGAALSAIDLRGVRINMAIEDGLRWLWTNQTGRAAGFPASPTTRWPTFWSSSEASLITLAFQNQGYRLADDGSAPTGIYEKYIVRRGLNYVFESLNTLALGPTPQGDDPCVGTPAADPCTGLFDNRHDSFHQSYTTGVASLAVAGSSPLTANRRG